MQISLQQLMPSFFEQDKVGASQVWNKNIVFTKGEHVHIIAPSGSGKTSLVHFLYGLRNDYTGKVLYGDSDITGFTAEDFSLWRRQHISIVFQDMRLFTDRTVMDNLTIKRSLLPYHKEDQLLSMARKLGIESKLNKLCSTCSYGEQQRIAIIRALQQPYDFLLLDEPFSHLDEANRKKAMQLMEEESAERKATIILADLRPIEYFSTEKRYLL